MTEKKHALEQALEAELADLAKLEAQLDDQREKIVARLVATRRRIDLIKALLENNASSAPTDSDSLVSPAPPDDVLSRNSRSVADIAHEILSRHGKEPMHYQELANLVRDRGGDLGGSNPAQTLVARIANDERFVRPARRGWYSLREFYPRTKSVGSRAKKKTAKRATRKARMM